MRTGYRLALGVVIVTVVAAIVLFIAEAVRATRDAHAYGQVSLPGRESVSLPSGDVIIYYGERIGRFEHSPLAVPSNLKLSVRTTSGQLLLGSTPYRFDQFNDGDYVRRSIAKLKVPEAGNYEAVSPTTVPGGVDPVISFGRDGTRDFGYVMFVLVGGLLLAAILAVGTAIVARTER
jgi:hypothetical protein